MTLYPLTFTPRYLPKIWGGRKLESVLGKALPPGAIGESWEICDRPDFSSVVAHGALKGATLRQVLLEFGPHLVGQEPYRQGMDRFPLLIKFIDACEDLSVQVHPDDDYAALRLGPDETGKTEMWVVLQADAGAAVVAGVEPGTDRLSFSRALAEGRVDSVLRSLPVTQGDALFVPAGLVHALGKGCLVAEVQQNSDTTFRVHDYGRLEAGKPRALHVQQALEVMKFDGGGLIAQHTIRRDDYSLTNLVECPWFKVQKVSAHPAFSPHKPQGSFHVLMGQQGTGTLEWNGGSLQVSAGTTVLCPANLDWRLLRKSEVYEVIWVSK